MKLFENIKNIIWSVVGIAAAIFIILKIINDNRTGIDLEKDTFQSSSLAALTNGEMQYTELMSNVNQYRTNQPWIAVSNDRIWSGLFNRDWSVEYSLNSKERKNEFGLMLGTGFGLYCQRTIFDEWTAGFEIIIDKENEFNAFSKIGYKW